MRLTVFNTPFLTGFLRIISSIGLRTIGWHAQGRDITHSKFVLIAAPHTSNWDFPLMLMVILKLRLRVFWMGKHTLFPFFLPFQECGKMLCFSKSRTQPKVPVQVRVLAFLEEETKLILG